VGWLRSATAARCALVSFCALGATDCKKGEPQAGRVTQPPPSSSHRSSIAAPVPRPQPRRGMVWIDPGPLVAGTPPGQLPRLADQEMPGEQVILKGFYIDVYPYPNEEGAIPLTNVTHGGAAKLCAEQDKRLCGELEWERACKGPDNTVFEYGNVYHADRCGTGAEPALKPSGLRVACRSEFGVRDLHGAAYEWTASPWGRGSEAGFMAVRGGNSLNGELTGRCANAEPKQPNVSSASIGFRCCAGPESPANVTLDVRRGNKLDAKGVVDKELARTFLAAMPGDAAARLRRSGQPRVEMFWIWRPVANEELHVARICAGLGKQPACGLLFVRLGLAAPDVLGWADSGIVPGSLHIEQNPRELWILAGDGPGPFKRWVGYAWGQISIGPIERHVDKPRKKTKKKR
jgi:formylglycine-generating enzyme